jgi:hypothetical protein
MGGHASLCPPYASLILPIHFPTPTAGWVTADGERFNYRFKRD